MKSGDKKFLAKHTKSSAALISLGIHAVLLVIAISFVAVTVITKEEKKFEAKPVNRPKMQLKKLQVPVNVKKKKTQKPKLRKRIVVQPRLNQSVPDIKMPEITGVKGGLGNAGGGIGGAGGVGFSMPEVNLFGIKSKGEKVFIILDASAEMMYDEMGGIPAYTLIKEELVTIMGNLPPTALFNVCIFDGGRSYLLFPQLVSANEQNITKVDSWLKPLNAVKPGMGVNEWGGRTLGKGGAENKEDFISGKFERMESWHRPVMLSMKQQADSIFLLTSWWGHQRIRTSVGNEEWLKTSSGKRYLDNYKKTLKMLEEDNQKRVADGQPPRVINKGDKRLMVRTYLPDAEVPPDGEYYYHEPKEYMQSMLSVRDEHRPQELRSSSGLKKKNRNVDFSLNVIRFTKAGAERSRYNDERSMSNFKKMTGSFKGEYRELAGLEAIKSRVSSDTE